MFDKLTQHNPFHCNDSDSNCIIWRRFAISLVQYGKRFLQAGKLLYVDPTTYDAMDDAVKNFANELKREDLHIGQLLGGGEFGEVYRGTLNKNFKEIDVVIKRIRVRSIS